MNSFLSGRARASLAQKWGDISMAVKIATPSFFIHSHPKGISQSLTTLWELKWNAAVLITALYLRGCATSVFFPPTDFLEAEIWFDESLNSPTRNLNKEQISTTKTEPESVGGPVGWSVGCVCKRAKPNPSGWTHLQQTGCHRPRARSYARWGPRCSSPWEPSAPPAGGGRSPRPSPPCRSSTPGWGCCRRRRNGHTAPTWRWTGSPRPAPGTCSGERCQRTRAYPSVTPAASTAWRSQRRTRRHSAGTAGPRSRPNTSDWTPWSTVRGGFTQLPSSSFPRQSVWGGEPCHERLTQAVFTLSVTLGPCRQKERISHTQLWLQKWKGDFKSELGKNQDRMSLLHHQQKKKEETCSTN